MPTANRRILMGIEPCPFCGESDVRVCASTFRWRSAFCDVCGANGPEVRVQTSGSGDPVVWEEQARILAIKEWNKRG